MAHVRPKILVVDDEPEAVELVEFNLKQAGYDVLTAADGAEALKKAHSALPSLIVLDLMLPEVDGLEVCKMLRRDPATASIPIVMVTAKAAEIDRILGLELGADDYVTKPFSPRELGARVKALLRRTEPTNEPRRVIEARGLSIDPSSYRVARDGKPVTLSTLEFRLLYYLATRPNRVFTRDQLLDAVWGTERFVTPRSVDVYIRRLREKVESDPDHPAFLRTVRGAGYMFEGEAQSEKQE
jgi:phosphate regulon transcriptional regulator PhoB